MDTIGRSHLQLRLQLGIVGSLTVHLHTLQHRDRHARTIITFPRHKVLSTQSISRILQLPRTAQRLLQHTLLKLAAITTIAITGITAMELHKTSTGIHNGGHFLNNY